MKRLIFVLLLVTPVWAAAQLSYPLNVEEWEGRYNLLDTNTGQLLNPVYRNWPRIDSDNYSCPVCGVNPGFEPGLIPVRRLDPPVVPDFDPNMNYLETNIYICGEDNLPPECSGETNVVKSVYTIIPRSLEDRELAITNEAAVRLQDMFPRNELWLRMIIQLGLNAYRLDSQNLPPKWQNFNDQQLTYIQTNVLPIWDCLQSYKTDVRAGNTPDVHDPAACWPNADIGALPE